MMFDASRYSILNRSTFLYCLICIILLNFVNTEYLQKQYTSYTQWLYASSDMQDIKSAVVYYENLARLGSYDAVTFMELGWAYFNLGDFDQAMPAYTIAASIQPRDKRIQMEFAFIQMSIKEILAQQTMVEKLRNRIFP